MEVQNFTSEIPHLVLRRVRKWTTKDLLQFRLVNKAWNQVAVTILDEQRHCMELDYEKCKQYMVLLAQSNEGAQKVDSINVNLLLVMSGKTRTMELDQAKQLLLQHRHVRVNAFNLTIMPDYRPPILEIQGFSALIARSLKHIKLNCTDWNLTHQTHPPYDINSPSSTFPCLMSIDYTLRDESEPGRSSSPTTQLLLNVIKFSPNLRRLSLEVWKSSNDSAQVDIELLLSASDSKVEELRICETTVGRNLTSGTLFDHVFPRLKTLHLDNGTRFLNNQFMTFISQKCPGLNILKFELWECTCSEIDVATLMSTEAPSIRCLQLLSAVQDTCLPPCTINAVFANVISSFVNLENLCTDIFIFNKLMDHLSRLRDQRQVLVHSNVRTLKIDIPANNRTLYTPNSAVEIYRATFSNLQNLSLEVHEGEHLSCDCHSTIRKALRFLGMHSGIISLETKNCAIGQVLKVPENSFAGLRSIKLMSSTRDCSPGSVRKIINLFPSVEFMQFDNSFISKDDINIIRASEQIINGFLRRHRN